MQVNITLENPKHCNGCKLIYKENYHIIACALHYWDIFLNDRKGKSIVDKRIVPWILKRPTQCIKDNGK